MFEWNIDCVLVDLKKYIEGKKKWRTEKKRKKFLKKSDDTRFKPSTLLFTGFVFSCPELTSMTAVGVFVFIFYVYFQFI